MLSFIMNKILFKADYPIVQMIMRLFKEQSSNFMLSKYMCMLFLETFYQILDQRNKVLTEMIRYAQIKLTNLHTL